MLSKQSKIISAVLLTMAMATPEMAVPAAAFLPAQSSNSGMKLDNSNLLTEVDTGYNWRKRRHGSKNFNGGNWNNNNGWNNNKHYRRHHNNNNWPYYGLAFGLGYGMGYGGGYGYNDGYYGSRYYSGGGDHVQWCLNRYRSYNPRTDTYMGFDGYRHRCRGPY